MKRVLYIPSEAVAEISKLLSLNGEDIENLRKILIDPNNDTVLEIYLDIINKINVSDDEAASIFKVYKYILLILEERELDFSQIVPEIKYILERSKIENYNQIIQNIDINSQILSKLFSAQSSESEHVKKKFLSSEIFNSVVNINSICDIRPVFNTERTEIAEFFKSISMEFTVKDSIDDLKVIPLSFDDEAFDDLLSEIKKIQQKKTVIEEKLSKLE